MGTCLAGERDGLAEPIPGHLVLEVASDRGVDQLVQLLAPKGLPPAVGDVRRACGREALGHLDGCDRLLAWIIH